MSNKPIKKSEQNKALEKMQKRKKTIIDDPPPYTYIISEGVKTEPNYIMGFANAVNEKYKQFSTGNRIVVKGTGRNTQSLLSFAREDVCREFPEASIVWLMYDKDDFPSDNFDNTQFSAEGKRDSRQYKVAWSNECIEMWFVLHFQDLTVNNGRKHYYKLLNERFPYAKSSTDIYDRLKDFTNDAIRRARQQYESYGDAAPSKRCPATKVYQLVEELQGYL